MSGDATPATERPAPARVGAASVVGATRGVAILVGLLCGAVAPSLAARPSPTDLDWLRKECGDGALLCQSKGTIYLTELSTGKTVTAGTGTCPEFSPDGSKLAWVDGDVARGRMRRGDDTVRVIAEGVDRAGGVHWCGGRHVLVVRGGRWRKVSLSGDEVDAPGLTALGTGGSECDVKLCADGVWSYVSGRDWRTSDGRRGRTGGTCSSSLSPDGRSVTGLHSGHKRCDLTSIRTGGTSGRLRWVYASKGSKGFDNHRWSSNDGRFVVCQDEKHGYLVVMKIGGTYCTRMGPRGGGEMYGDFTVGDGTGEPWPGAPTSQLAAHRDAWPPDRSGLAFVWQNAAKANAVAGRDAKDVRVCRVLPRGVAKPGHHHDMLLEGGVFLADEKSSREVMKRCAASGEISLEATVTPSSLRDEGSRTILAVASPGGSAALSVRQDGARVTALVGDAHAALKRQPIELFTLRAARPHHVLVSYVPARRDANLVCHLDGARVLATAAPRISLARWTRARLSFGGVESGGARWTGRIEGVAVYDRAVDGGRARRHHRAYAHVIADRELPERVVLRGVRTAVSTLPDPGPYPLALIVDAYAVQKVESGTLDAERILVAHWGVLNGRPQRDVASRGDGRALRLVLEPFSAHPELKDLKLVDDVCEFDLPLYYDVGQHGSR